MGLLLRLLCSFGCGTQPCVVSWDVYVVNMVTYMNDVCVMHSFVALV